MTVVIPGVGIVFVPWYIILFVCVLAAAIIGAIIALIRAAAGKH